MIGWRCTRQRTRRTHELRCDVDGCRELVDVVLNSADEHERVLLTCTRCSDELIAGGRWLP